MFFLSSDNHGSVDLRLNSKNFIAGQYLKRSDKVAFLGDEELHLYKNRGFEFLAEQKWTSLLIEGNHDHLPTYFNAPLVEFCGGNARQLAENIYYLQRGEVYEIDNKKFFVMGGALSIDRNYRYPEVSWFEAEVPSEADFKFAEQRLESLNWEVDYVLSHTCPLNCIDLFFLPVHPNDAYYDKTWDRLENIREKLKFKHWYFGHWHRDVSKEEDGRKYTILYREIRALEK
ncbi:MAG: hypothetical protein C0602_08025 [Denitrovibrio sp.]|nr:MAG: hypothetical protein C0602_08025 [Denitrovibrio sp.]